MVRSKLLFATLIVLAAGLTGLGLIAPSLRTSLNVLPFTLERPSILNTASASLQAGELNGPTFIPGSVVTGTENLTGSLKVATAISKFFGVDAEAVLALHQAGHGYGEIVKAYALAKATGKTAEDIFAMRGEKQGWGQILKSLAAPKWTSVGKVMHGQQGNPSSLGATAPGKSGEHRQDQGKGKGGKGDDDDDQGENEGKGKGNK